MLFPNIDAHDIIHPRVQALARAAEERGDALAAWHGNDAFTGEAVEILLNLTRNTGAMALGRAAFSAKVGEKGDLIVLHMDNPARGMVEFRHGDEHLAMNLERSGIDVFNDGRNAHLRLFDKLTGGDILTLEGDQIHDLVDQKVLDPKNYHVSAFKYAEGHGAL